MHDRNEQNRPPRQNGEIHNHRTPSEAPHEPVLPADILIEAFAKSPLAMAILRAGDRTVLEVNEAWERLFGHRRDEVLGNPLAGLGLWTAREQAEQLFSEELFRKGRIRGVERTLATESGKSFIISFSAYIIKRKAGPDAIFAIWRDVTDRKRAEKQLKEKEHLLSESQRITHVGSWSFLVGRENVEWTDETYRIYGVSRESFVPSEQNFLNLIHPDDRPAMQEWIRSCLAGEEPGELEFRIEHSDGTTRILIGRGTLEVDSEGNPVKMVGTVQDITERKRAEEALREANVQLETRVEQRTADLAQRESHLRALARELTLSEQRERARLAGILHDNLQQLLAAAKFGLADLQAYDDPVVQYARNRVERLLNESIQMSRSLTAELSPPVLHEHGLPAGLEWLVRWMSSRHGISINLVIKEDIPPVPEALNVLLFEAVRELAFNAVKHAGVKEVQVDLYRAEAGQLQITVSDKGAGFDPNKLKEVGGPNRGFGLFSIKERLTLLGGQMCIDSAPGKGSRITLQVPLGEIPEPETLPETTELRPAARRTLSKLGAPIRVLLADDHTVMREGLARLLSREPDIEVLDEAASNGKEAVELTAALLPDIVLMDISMPVMSGIEATTVITRTHPGIRIIGLSMFDQEESARAMINAGAVKYLSKSGPSAELISTIRKSMVG